jgi:hypothetical protein
MELRELTPMQKNARASELKETKPLLLTPLHDGGRIYRTQL